MNREIILNEFTANIKSFQQYARNIANEQDADDLFQACVLMLWEFPEERLIAAYNPAQGLKPFFIRMLQLQYNSKTSYFHKDYRKQEIDLQKKTEDIILNAPQSEEEFEPGYFETINKACESIYDHAGSKEVADLEKVVWELYVETGSLRKTVDALPSEYADLLDLKSVHTIVRKFRRTIKERLFFED